MTQLLIPRYRALIQTMMRIDDALRQEKVSPLTAEIDAVKTITAFFRDDPALQTTIVGYALRVLVSDLQDVEVGAHPRNFKKKPGSGKRGAVVGKSFDGIRGVLVAALDELLTDRLMTRDAASNFLAKELKKQGFRFKDQPLTAATLLQWREQTGDTAPKAADDMVKAIKTLVASKRPVSPSAGASLRCSAWSRRRSHVDPSGIGRSCSRAAVRRCV